jgi:hypothetical protein
VVDEQHAQAALAGLPAQNRPAAPAPMMTLAC